MQRINREQENENIIKEWIKNFKIHRIIANHANGNKETIWKSIKETTKMMLRR